MNLFTGFRGFFQPPKEPQGKRVGRVIKGDTATFSDGTTYKVPERNVPGTWIRTSPKAVDIRRSARDRRRNKSTV